MLEEVIKITSLGFEVLILAVGFYRKIIIGYTEEEDSIIVEEFSYKILEVNLIGDVWHVKCENFMWYELPWKTIPVIYENEKEGRYLKGITTIPIVTRKRWFRRNQREILPGKFSKELHL